MYSITLTSLRCLYIQNAYTMEPHLMFLDLSSTPIQYQGLVIPSQKPQG